MSRLNGLSCRSILPGCSIGMIVPTIGIIAYALQGKLLFYGNFLPESGYRNGVQRSIMPMIAVIKTGGHFGKGDLIICLAG